MSSTTPVSPLAELPQPFALVAHDAGAANHLLAWLARAPSVRAQAFLEGPAARLGSGRIGTAALAATLEEALDGARVVVTGSGWASDLEHRARKAARARGLASIGVVDHWVNYAARFSRAGETVWPDEFWVADAEAAALAREAFPGARVRQQPNFYLQDEVAGIAPVATAPPVLLVVLEPARDDWGRGTPGEFQALDYLVERLPLLALPEGVVLRLRPHPSDPPGKYLDWIAARRADLPVELDASPTLAAAISGARWVAGCESYALVVALAAGREVFGTLPPWAPPCRLPQAGIRQLRSL